jgi:transketolase
MRPPSRGVALASKEQPVALVLTRQDAALTAQFSAADGLQRGGYILPMP